MLDIQTLKQHFADNQKQVLADYFAFLRFESIATDPAYESQVYACADFVEKYLQSCKLEVERWGGGKAPNLFAQNLEAGPDKPTVLLYNHYDVQPVDPLNLWTSPPFEPTIREGKIFARGAQDNKGQCMYTLFALKTLIEKLGKYPLNIKYLVEGEEESGSGGLIEALPLKKEALKSDYLLVIDSGVHNLNTPSITLGGRGIVTFTLKLTGSKYDLHSGLHGGIAYNPNRALAELLASLHDKDHRVNIPGFYDDVTTLTKEEKKAINLDWDEKQLKEYFNITPSGQEKGFLFTETATVRPTLEINGISGGYAGEGFKTVIPAEAQAKISCRLVPNQDPIQIAEQVKETLLKRVAPGCELEVIVHPGIGKGFRTDPQSKSAQIMSSVYSEVFNKPCQNILMGGSVPISADLAAAAESELLLLGLGLPEDQIHAPDEHFDLERLELGFLLMALGLQKF